MALNRSVKFSQHKYFGTLADILAAEAAGLLDVGFEYETTDQAEAQKYYSVLNNKLERLAFKSYVDAQVAAETAARVSAITTVTNAIDQEASARVSGDTTLQSNINTLNTQLTQALANAVATLRDTTVSDIVPYAYAADESASLASIMPANAPDGIYEIAFSTADWSNVMTVTGLPVGSDANAGAITHGDRLRVKVDGGVIVTAIKLDDVTKAKFESLDSQIASMTGSTVTGAINGTRKVGSNVLLGGALTEATEVSGAFDLTFSNQAQKLKKMQLGIYNIDAQGNPTTHTGDYGFVFLNAARGIGYVLPN